MKSYKFVATLLVGLGAHSAHADDVPAAIVADFNVADLVTLHSQVGELQLGAGLAAGETVSVKEGGYIKLLVGEECVVVGDPPEDQGCTTPEPDRNAYTVPQSGLFSGMNARYQRFQKVLSWWDPKTESRVMRSREGLVAQIPALAEVDESFLTAGARQLHIQWMDGTAPFRIAILDANGKELAAQDQERDRNATLPVTIEKGAVYRLQLESAGNVAASYVLRGQPADAFADDDGEAPILRAMKIVEGVSDSEGAWALEAVQVLRTLPLDDRIRQAVLDAVNFADWP